MSAAAEAAPDARPPIGDLRHGWTLAGLDRAVHIAITRRSWYASCDPEERYAAGWHAAVELLYTAGRPPTEQEMIRAAWTAADLLTSRTGEQRGHPRARGEHYTGRTDYPRWHAYWQTVTRPTASPEERVVEHLALAQVWPRLTPTQQEALTALATHDTYHAAAHSLGLTITALYARIGKARIRVLALWHEHETPRRLPTEKRVLSHTGYFAGRRLPTEADLERLRERRTQGATLRELAKETGYSRAALSRQLRGMTRTRP